MTLSERHAHLVEKGLQRLPDCARDDARKYILDRLRPILNLKDHQIYSALGAAVDRFQRKYGVLI